MRLLLAASLVALALAGCFGDDPSSGDSADGADDGDGLGGNGTFDGNGTVTGGANATVSPDGNDTGTGAGVSWSYDNRTGEVSGTALIVAGQNAEEETFQVANGTVRLMLNITVDGDPVEVRIAAGDCQDEDCQQAIDVSSGSAMTTYEMPVEGEWTVIFESGATAGPYSTSYTLDIAIAGEGF